MMRVAWPCCPIDGGRLIPNSDLDLACLTCGRVLYRQAQVMEMGGNRHGK